MNDNVCVKHGTVFALEDVEDHYVHVLMVKANSRERAEELFQKDNKFVYLTKQTQEFPAMVCCGYSFAWDDALKYGILTIVRRYDYGRKSDSPS
jgi:hypothetical protein